MTTLEYLAICAGGALALIGTIDVIAFLLSDDPRAMAWLCRMWGRRH